MRQQTLINYYFNDIQIRHWAIIKFVIVVTAIMLCGTLDTSAQKKRVTKKRNTKISKKSVNKPSPNPVTVVNSAHTDYLSGEASVFVNPKQPTIIRLGLSQNAVSIVEFPASDGVYYIHEGNPKLVSVFQSPTRETDRSITIYPGEGFVPLRGDGGRKLSSTITLQMRSGLILILEFVPVSSIRQNAHRCVINYKRDEIIAARRTAGLAYNLGEDIKPDKKKNIKASSKLVSSLNKESKEDNSAEKPPIRQTSLSINRGMIGRRTTRKSKKRPKTGLELSRFVNKKLAESLKKPKKILGEFTKPENGLSMAVSPVTEIDADQRLVIVAVKNRTLANLKLVPGVPELQILSLDEKGNALQTERVERTYVESTSFEGSISPETIAFYAVVFKAPIVGSTQRLRVLISHREAADKPSTFVLPKVNEAKRR